MGIDEKEFLKNEMVQDAVIRKFEIIGEATKQLNASFRNKYPEVPWKNSAGLRDKLIHDYIGVDILAVWRIVEQVLPAFMEQIEFIIFIEENDGDEL